MKENASLMTEQKGFAKMMEAVVNVSKKQTQIHVAPI
jgi:hypothetical protein